MGDISSTCYNNTTQLQQVNLIRDMTKTQKPITNNLQQVPETIKQTFKTAFKSKYLNINTNQSTKLSYSQIIFSLQGLIRVTRNIKLSSNNTFDFLSKGLIQLYLKPLSSGHSNQHKIQHNENSNDNEQFTGIYLVYFPNYQYFIGTLQNNQPIQGIFVFQNQCYYVGKIKSLYAEGEGEYLNKQNGYKYEGSWSKNLQHGIGKQFYSNGDAFEGNFVWGNKLGQGIYKFSDGRKFQGNYYNNLCAGKGTYYLTQKQWYKGEWDYGSINGKGEYHYPNGDVYYGEFKNGQKSGRGRYVFAGGYEYDGEWSEGNMHGKGVIRQGYDEIEGEWYEGKKIQ